MLIRNHYGGVFLVLLLLLLSAGCDVSIAAEDPAPVAIATPQPRPQDAKATIEAQMRSRPALYSLAMTSATDGWAVGRKLGMAAGDAALMHWDGTRWTDVPAPHNGLLRQIHMASPNEGWAVGDRIQEDGSTSSLILHYSAGQWQEVASPSSASLYGVYTVSPTEAWAVGLFDVLHYYNGQWAAVPINTPVHVQTVSIAMTSPTDGWIVGAAEDGGNDIALHYTGGQWAATRLTVRTAPSRIQMRSAAEGWTVGSYGILHYSGGVWQRVNRPVTKPLRSVFMVSATEGWAVGVNDNYSPSSNLMLHYAAGAWQVWRNPPPAGILATPPPRPFGAPSSIPGNEVSDVAMVSPVEGWAVSRTGDILHYANGSWLQYFAP